MANVNMSEVTAILKEDVDPMIRDLFFASAKSPLARLAKEGRNAGEGTSDFLNGDKAYIVARYGRHSGVRSQGEESTLPQGKTQKERMYFSPKILNGSFRITLKAVQGTKNRQGAVVDELSDSVEQMLERAQIQLARQAHNDGTGTLALVNDSTPNSITDVTVDAVRSVNLADIIQKGDELNIGTAAEMTGTGSPFAATVSSVNSNTNFTIVETTSALADDDLVSFKDNYVDSAYTEKMGMLGLVVTSGTVQALALATRSYLQSYVDTQSVALTKRFLVQYLMKNAAYSKGANYAVVMGDLFYYAIELFVGTQQSDPAAAATIFHGGAEGLMIHWVSGSCPIVFDPLARPASVLGVDLSNVGYKQLYAMGLIEDGGKMVHRVSGSTVYEVAASEAGNFYIIDPKTCFRLENKTNA